jgi:hypothetical protein
MSTRADAITRWRIALAVIAVLAALTGAGIASRSASAVNVGYCTGWPVDAFQHCDASERHSLTANQAYNYYGQSYQVCAGATLDGSFYGSYACGSQFAEHCYGAANLLVGRIHNSESFTQTMRGVYFYSETCP